MSMELDILSDVRKALEEMEGQNHRDKIETLSLLIKKYAHFGSCELLIGEEELNETISGAISLVANRTFPVFLGFKKVKVRQEDQVKLCLLESFVSVLNKRNCLKKVPRFNYIEDSFKED